VEDEDEIREERFEDLVGTVGDGDKEPNEDSGKEDKD
jgi:hypothetical protein